MAKFTHCAIATAHISETLHFYCEICEMRLVRDRRQGFRICWLAPKTTPAPILVVIEHPEVPEASEGSDSMLRHFGFELESREAVDAMYEYLHSKEIPATKPFFVDEFTGYITMAKDPDGRWVEFSHGQDVSESNWDLPQD